MPGNAERTPRVPAASSNGGTSERRNRKRRLQLSCGECRKKKLSCDRTLPCQRCLKSGRPEQCSFEGGTGQPPFSNTQLAQQQAQYSSEEIKNLRAEVAQLKELLHVTDNVETGQAVPPNKNLEEDPNPADATTTGLSDPRRRSPRGYYGQHTLFKFFEEIPQLFPFIKETFDEWLRPLGVQLKKNKSMKSEWKTNVFSQGESQLEGLLPPKDDVDALLSFYLKDVEQLHRIVHIPTFEREYASFWIPGRTRYPAMTALILSMISISACASISSNNSAIITSTHRAMPVKWISACDEWLEQQSSKHRKLVHYQISCLLYLAKRMNIVRKKRFWKETGSLMQNAIIDGLHCDPSSAVDGPYLSEMKRRIWAVIRELDLQNAFEYGLPTLLHNIDCDVTAPANLNDQDFGEASKVLPMSEPSNHYTCTSYQYHSSRSWNLRLDISRRLFSTGLSNSLSYEDVLRYTHELTQAIHSLPPWDIDQAKDGNSPKLLMLTHAFLNFQLKECVLAIHRPYLQRDNSKFWISENICYHMARDVLLLNSKLAEFDIQSLTLFREDLLLAALNVTRITMLQPKGSTSVTMTNPESAIILLEQCLPLMEERYLRCLYGEPWCFVTMCAAIMLLKIRLGQESWQTAKSSCAQRFLDLHYKHFGGQQTYLQQPTPGATAFSASAWLDSSYADIVINPLDLDTEVDDIWESWESTWPTSPAVSGAEGRKV